MQQVEVLARLSIRPHVRTRVAMGLKTLPVELSEASASLLKASNVEVLERSPEDDACMDWRDKYNNITPLSRASS